MPGLVNVVIVGDASSAAAMLAHLDAALMPRELARFLSDRVEHIIKERAANRFREEGDDVTGTWAPLSRYTQEIRARKGFGAAHPINKRTGELERYILNSQSNIVAGSTGASMRYPASQPSGDLWEKLYTAQNGQPGGRRTRETPARPVLGVNERDLELILAALAFHIQIGVGTP